MLVVIRQLHRWAHRRGIARTMSTSHDGSRIVTGYVQGRGPRWLAERLAWFAVVHTPYWTESHIDRIGRVVTGVEQPGRFTYRFHLRFRTVRR